MSDWYRNDDWTDEIAAAFEARLARSRSQKAQYLSLQGHRLIRNHPAAARDLLRRAVTMDDDHETVRAMAFLATAQLACGDIDAAIATYEEALERQVAHPHNVAVHPCDYLLLVGLFRRADRLGLAEPIADALPDETLFGPDPQLFAAKALLLDLAGPQADAGRYAALALPLLAEMPDVAALGVDIGELRRRLEAIAS